MPSGLALVTGQGSLETGLAKLPRVQAPNARLHDTLAALSAYHAGVDARFGWRRCLKFICFKKAIRRDLENSPCLRLVQLAKASSLRCAGLFGVHYFSQCLMFRIALPPVGAHRHANSFAIGPAKKRVGVLSPIVMDQISLAKRAADQDLNGVDTSHIRFRYGDDFLVFRMRTDLAQRDLRGLYAGGETWAQVAVKLNYPFQCLLFERHVSLLLKSDRFACNEHMFVPGSPARAASWRVVPSAKYALIEKADTGGNIERNNREFFR